MPAHPKTITLSSFSGLNNILPPERTDPKYLKTAMNVDIDRSGGVRKRKGYTKVLSGDFHSLWSDGNDCFAVRDGDLVRIYSDYSTDTVLSNVGLSRLSYERAEGKIYFVSKETKGVIEDNSYRRFGIPSPNPQPTLSASTGIMTSGTYQVSITFVSEDGRESGAGVAQTIELSSNSGIQLSNIPTSSDSTVDRVRIYCSTPNGMVLYLVDTIAHGVSSFKIADVIGGVTPLQSFNVYDAPYGQIIRLAHGRLWIAQDDILWYSEPYSYEWWKPHSNFISFDSTIRAVMPTEGGMWIATDKLNYLTGKNPVDMRLKEVEPVKAVQGSDVKIVGAYLFIENTPIGYKWLITTDRGIFACYNDGIALNLTEKNVAFPAADEGTAMFVQEDGINRYVSIIKEKHDSQNTVVGDMVTSTIIRNGVTID